jgi:hypothetical protein
MTLRVGRGSVRAGLGALSSAQAELRPTVFSSFARLLISNHLRAQESHALRIDELHCGLGSSYTLNKRVDANGV